MAGIDKIYCKSYKEYSDFINWAKENTFTCPNGLKLYPINYIYDWDKNIFDDKTLIPVMNTPQELDYFLIKYCPCEFVQDTLKRAYTTFYNEVKQGISDYDKFDINKVKIATKYKIIERPKNKEYPYRKSNRIGLYKRNSIWNIYARYGEYFIDIKYSNILKRFIYENELAPSGISTMDKFRNCKTIKSLCRQLIKAKIPSDTLVTIQGYYIGEYWKIKFY